MKRTALFVDAGYFYAAGAALITQQPKTPRANISITDPETVVASLIHKTTLISPHELLRVYWYDAMRGSGMSLEQNRLALQDNLKIRLGTLNGAGEQKGVDNLLVTDMIDLARNGAISDAIVLTGDEDLRIAVTVAQSFGVRVHLLGIDPIKHNMSQALRMDADSVHTLGPDWVKDHLTVATPATPGSNSPAPTPPADTPPAPTTATPIVTVRRRTAAAPTAAEPAAPPATPDNFQAVTRPVVHRLVAAIPEDTRQYLIRHFETSTSVPPEYDRPLIRQASDAMNRLFSGKEMRELRGMFVTELRTQTPG